MLTLSRKVGEGVVIAGNVRVTVLSYDRRGVRLGFTAPPDVGIWREELLVNGLPPAAYRRRETVQPDSELARARPLQPESPAEEDADE